MEVAFAIVGNEKGAHGAVSIVSAKIPGSAVELCDDAVISNVLQHVDSGRSIAQGAREAEILPFIDAAEFRAVFAKMLFQLFPGAEARAGVARDRGARACRGRCRAAGQSGREQGETAEHRHKSQTATSLPPAAM